VKSIPKNELPCITTSDELKPIVMGQIAWALYLMMQEGYPLSGDPLPHEELWKGGGGKSDEWLKAVLNDLALDSRYT
jgi:hypothetical protein